MKKIIALVAGVALAGATLAGIALLALNKTESPVPSTNGTPPALLANTQSSADEWTEGYNSAIRQFAPKERIGEMTIKKEAYTTFIKTDLKQETTPEDNNETHHSPYADGYHKALDVIVRQQTCPGN